jgi:hypothetical protein
MNWRSQAFCALDKDPKRWISFDLEDIQYAKAGCASCKVIKQCALHAGETEDMITGVIAGLSEFDRLIASWKEVNSVHDDNWE